MAYGNILFPFIINVQISQKTPIIKIVVRCQFCLLTTAMLPVLVTRLMKTGSVAFETPRSTSSDSIVRQTNKVHPLETGLPRLSKNWHISSDFSEKSESSPQSLRNCEKGMEFLMCDEGEDEHYK